MVKIFSNLSTVFYLVAFMLLNSCKTSKALEKNIPVSDYKLIWNDEFDGKKIDSSKWAFRTDVKHNSAQLKEKCEFK